MSECMTTRSVLGSCASAGRDIARTATAVAIRTIQFLLASPLLAARMPHARMMPESLAETKPLKRRQTGRRTAHHRGLLVGVSQAQQLGLAPGTTGEGE